MKLLSGGQSGVDRAVFSAAARTYEHRFPPPWSVEDPDMKLGQDCFIVRDAPIQSSLPEFEVDAAADDILLE